MTLLDLQTRIATDLTRSDLTAQIANAVSDAIKFYENERFWFNTTRSLTFATVPGQYAYGVADLAQIPLIVRLDKLFLHTGTIGVYPLDRYEDDDFEFLLSGTMGPGRPTCFCYVDQQILLWPIPTSVWTMRPHMHYNLAPLVNPTDTNSWCTDAEELIRSHAKMLLYMDVLEDDAGAQRMQTKLPTLAGVLRSKTTGKGSTGMIRPTDF